MTCDVAIVGGGFFGCMIALHLRKSFTKVAVLEAGGELLGRASYSNQARVHNGYHYPRSLLTALRSRANYPRFVAEFGDCLDRTFSQYYAVGRDLSKVNARQFAAFFRRVGAPIAPAPETIRRLFDPYLVEEVFAVEECAFDAVRLRRRLGQSLGEAGVAVRLGWEVRRAGPGPDAGVRLWCETPEGPAQIVAGSAYNCTYSRLNRLLADSGLPTIPLKHELAEMALIRVPEALRGMGFTLMCGPFFSVMPFPPRGLHTLSHVRYTPHESWRDGDGPAIDPDRYLGRGPRRSHFPHMLRDATRYLPKLSGCTYVESLWETKTVPVASEVNDSRPILIRTHPGLPALHSVLGGKIDNIYDALLEIDDRSGLRRAG